MSVGSDIINEFVLTLKGLMKCYTVSMSLDLITLGIIPVPSDVHVGVLVYSYMGQWRCTINARSFQ